MARISGIDLPSNKRVEVGLTYIYGIGRQTSKKILTENNISFDTKIGDLSEEDLAKLRASVGNYRTEGDLRRDVSLNIKRIQDLGTYKGLRHRRRLPVNGQRTKTNARTRKTSRRSVSGIRK